MRWTIPVLKMRRQEAIKLLDLPIDTRVFEPKDTVFTKYIIYCSNIILYVTAISLIIIIYSNEIIYFLKNIKKCNQA